MPEGRLGEAAHVALDGTKVKANASKHKAMIHERMLKTERPLEVRLRCVRCCALLRKFSPRKTANTAKTSEVMSCPMNRNGAAAGWNGSASQRLNWRLRRQRLKPANARTRRLRQKPVATPSAPIAHRRSCGALKRADDAQKLAIETAEVARLESQLLTEDSDPVAMPQRQLPTDGIGNPKLNAQRKHRYAEAFGYTDPVSHILKGANVWIHGYNCQAAVDGGHQVIVAIGVSNQPSDAVRMLPILERIQTITGQQPAALTKDAGYCSTANLEACEQRGFDAFISISRQQHGQRGRASRCRQPKGLDASVRMDRKLRSKARQAVYALRKTVVKPVFGQIRGPGAWIGFVYEVWIRSTGNGSLWPPPTTC